MYMLDCVELEAISKRLKELNLRFAQYPNYPKTRLIVGQLLLKARCRDAFLTLRVLAKVINKRWDSAGTKYDFLLNPTTPHPPSIKAPLKNKDYESHACCFSLISYL